MRFRLALVSIFFLAACAHKGPQRPNSESANPVESYRVTDPQPPAVVDVELEQIPDEMNPMVEKWVNYFQNKGRPHMERYLARSTRYSALMKKILRQNGLPEDLIYIALIESGFSSRATSRAAAVGYWQFIRPTGRRYNLQINALVDERRDPVLSTQAASDYLKTLYADFGSWYLAMASYNVGENRVKREINRNYTRDFWVLARKKRFPKETINYVPKFLAAKLIGKDPAKFGFVDIDYEKPIEFETVKIAKSVNLKKMSEAMGLEYEDLKTLNPKFRGEIAPVLAGNIELRIPLGQGQIALAAAQQSAVDKVELIADAGETETYRVRSGDSLYIIAKRYRTTVAWLRDTNELKSGRKLRIGQRLQVPDRSAPKRTALAAKAQPKKNLIAMASKVEKPLEDQSAKQTEKPTEKASEKPVEVAVEKSTEDREKAAQSPEVVTPEGVFYIVQTGDTLSSIAEDYDSSVRELRKMNRMRQGQILKIGMRIKVPKDDGLPSEPEVSENSKSLNAGKTEQKINRSEASDDRLETTQTQLAANVHVVKKGESLFTIAKKYGVTMQELKKANKLSNRSVLRVGFRLAIPGLNMAPAPSSAKRAKSRVHFVKAGENLHRIAQKYSVSVDRLRKINRLKNMNVLAGSRLVIPLTAYY